MFRNLLKVLVLGATVVSTLASAAPASAWTTNGTAAGVGFTATSGTTRLSFVPGASVTCAGPNSMVGKLFGPNPNAARLADVQPQFGGCTVSGLGVTITCTSLGSTSPLPAALRGTSYSAPVTTGAIDGLRCVVTIPNCVITVTGSSPATYTNTAGVLTVLASTPSLNYTATGSVCAALGYSGTGTSRWANGSGTNAVYTVTSTPLPVITN